MRLFYMQNIYKRQLKNESDEQSVSEFIAINKQL